MRRDWHDKEQTTPNDVFVLASRYPFFPTEKLFLEAGEIAQWAEHKLCSQEVWVQFSDTRVPHAPCCQALPGMPQNKTKKVISNKNSHLCNSSNLH